MEDGCTVDPLQISNMDLSDNSPQTDYLLEELNYRMQNCNFEPITLKEVNIYY